ncbi:hypothetical protein OG920_42350 [Streptomyces europaeiscabiei]|uniref:hypothetical protein n=1 Tax=Streptomyces europaeiscabiei TaxID=146819 RepID=UPI002E17E0B4
MQVLLQLSARKIFTVMAMADALFVGSVLTAQAASFDSMHKADNTYWDCEDDGYCCRTDNGYPTFGIEAGMTTADDNDVREVLGDEYGPTDLERHEHTGSEMQYDGSSETDIIFDWNDPSLAAGVNGVTWCNDAASEYECDQHHISFDNMGGGSANPWKAVVCHETGHAVGLTHGGEAAPAQSHTDSDLGCMRTGGSAEQLISWTNLGSHNVGQINDVYVKP